MTSFCFISLLGGPGHSRATLSKGFKGNVWQLLPLLRVEWHVRRPGFSLQALSGALMVTGRQLLPVRLIWSGRFRAAAWRLLRFAPF